MTDRAAWMARWRGLPRSLLVLAVGLLSATGVAADGTVAATDPQVRAADLERHVDRLASDEFGGREAGTEGARRAAAYLAAELQRAGVEPAGTDGTWLQRFAVPTPVLGEGNRLEAATPEGATAFRVETDWNPFSLSASGEAAGDLTFAGYGITASGREWDDYAGLDVRGKVVLLLRKDPGWNDVRHAAFVAKLANAAKHGAAALLLCNNPATTAGGADHLWSWRASAGGGVGTGPIPFAFVTQATARRLLAPLGRSLEDLETALRSKGPQSAAVAGVRVSLRIRLAVSRVPNANNVVGLLRGTDASVADEHLIVGAHYDHLGLGNFGSLGGAAARGRLHPGADDNASGTAAVLELAEYFARAPTRPRRSILFVLFTGEEKGLLGSSHYVAHPKLPLEDAVAMFNLDMVGRSRESRLRIGGVGTAAGLQALLAEANKPHGLNIAWGQGGAAPSDSLPFFRKRVPVLFFFTGVHGDYHRPSDTPDRLDYAAHERVTRLVRDAMTEIANRDERLAFTTPPAPPRRPRLGVSLDARDDVDGAVVRAVVPGGPAARGGLRAGDVIVALGGNVVRGRRDLLTALAGAGAGKPVEVVVLRGDARVVLEVVPSARGGR